jgi:transposase-like protein
MVLLLRYRDDLTDRCREASHPMPVQNDDVPLVFEKIADLLEIRGEGPFRVRAYRNGALEVRGLSKKLAGLAQEHADFERRPGIGTALFRIRTLMELSELGYGSRTEPLPRGILASSKTHSETAMFQHFLLTAEARTLSVLDVFALSDEEVFELLREQRWGKGEAVTCPDCGAVERHWFLPSRRQWRCKACAHTFSVTSGTIFAHHKLPLRVYLAAVAIYANAVKGLSVQPWFELVSFSTCRTVSREMRSNTSSSTNWSASRRKGQRARRCGGGRAGQGDELRLALAVERRRDESGMDASRSTPAPALL